MQPARTHIILRASARAFTCMSTTFSDNNTTVCPPVGGDNLWASAMDGKSDERPGGQTMLLLFHTARISLDLAHCEMLAFCGKDGIMC